MIKNSLILGFLLMLLGCSGGMSHISDDELREKVLACDYMVDGTAPELQVCKNYKRECKSRNKSGQFIC
jgi:hypothetical protein